MKVDFDKLKRDVSLPEFFLYLGWKFVSGSSNSSPKMSNGSDTVIIKKNSKDYYTYWDVHGEARGKTIIDLMQKHIYDQTGRMPSLREAGEAVQNYVNNKEVVLSQDSRFGVSNAKLDPNQLAFLNSQLKPYQGDFLQREELLKIHYLHRYFPGYSPLGNTGKMEKSIIIPVPDLLTKTAFRVFPKGG